MRMKASIGGFSPLLAILLVCLALVAVAKTGDNKDKGKDPSSAATASHNVQDDTARLEGEKRFRSNCARCHVAPPKFAPRVTATVLRHMRVRATITEDDTRFILHYMTQ